MSAVASGYVGILSFDLHFPGEHSLKGKRKHLLTLKSHLQQRAGASVAEVDHHDVWQRARLTVTLVDREARELDERLDRCERLVYASGADVGPFKRVRRVNELLRQILSEALAEMTDPGLGFVTITSVDTTRDFEHATVYVSVLGNELKRERSLRALERAKARLQARVGREVTLRRTPRLRFAYDETFDKGRRIEQLLAEHEPMPDPAPEGPEGEPGDEPEAPA
jgi:ribosome-binding factor A